MAITVKHSKVSAIPDGDDTSVVRPSDWNADHTLSGTVPVANGGTGASTLTGYVKGNGTSAMTAATTIPNTDVTGLGTASTKDAGIANGVATLDSSGQVPLSQIPPLGDLNYQGTWNATTNSPTLTSSVGTKGFYYVVSVAGTTNLNGITDWQIGDWAVFNGSVWQKIDNTDAVTSVNGYTGAVVLTAADVGAVPYTGATGAVDLNAKSLVNVSNLGVNTTTVPTIKIRAVGDNNSGSRIAMRGYSSDANSSSIRVTKFRGTTSAPQAPLSGDSLGKFELAGYGTTSSEGYPQSSLEGVATENWGATARGAKAVVKVTPNTTITQVTALTIDQDSQATFANTVTANGVLLTGNTGTVTSVAATAGTGISVSGSPITTSGTLTITNTAPDQTVALTAGTGISTSGTYPNFTITNTAPSSGGTVTSVTGTAPIISSGGNTPAISMPAATTSVSGYLTSTDWNTFNGKQPAGTYVNSVSATSPVTSSGGTTPTIAIPAATTSVSGYLTSTDWNTFNNKGSGSVTSVAATVPSFLSVSGSPITTSGTLALTYSGTALPILNGGTGQTTASAAFNALSPLTTAGDVLYGGTSGAGTRLPIGTAGQVLTVNAGATAPQWSTPTTGTVTAVSVASANGFAGTSSGGATPALTLSTSITGVLKGNATAISAATAGTDYSAGTSALTTGILKSTTTTGALSIAVAADFPTLNQNTTGTAANVTGIVLGANGGTGVANTGSTITIAGNLTHAGAFTQSFTATGNTAVTLPTSGTLISTVTNMAANPVTGTPSSSNFLRGDGTWASPTAGLATYTRTNFTATAGQTSFTVAYTVGYVEVFVNGVLLDATDYTSTSGTAIVLATAAALNDIVTVIAYNATTATTAAGSTTQVQYNSGGNFAGSANLTFDGTTLTGAFSGAHNGTVGATTPSTVVATQLTVNGSNLNTAISPTGTGTVTIAPAGATTLGTAGVATTMNGNISATASNQTITLSPKGTGTVAISPVGALTINPTAASTINNTSIGATTASTGAFTTLSATTAIALTSGGTGKASAPAANANLMGFTTTATAAGTTTLDNTSSYIQYFTGTSAQTIKMPVTSTLATGWSFHICNNSTVAITINSSGSNLIGTIAPNTTVHITCVATGGTTASDWDFGTTDFGALLGNDGTVPLQAQWYLSSAGGNIGSTIANFFGANSAVSLDASGTYDIEAFCYFLKNTAGTVTWGGLFSSAPTVCHAYLEYTPVTGFTTSLISGAMVTAEQTAQAIANMAFAATASLTTAVYHIAKFRIRVTTNAACNFRLNITQSAGTVTPQAGSWYTARKIATNSGTFVA